MPSIQLSTWHPASHDSRRTAGITAGNRADTPLAGFDAGDERGWSHPMIVAAGRLADAKNYPLLLDAVALLRRRLPARLVVLGQGEREGMLRDQAARLGIGEAVSFRGFQRNPWKYIARG